MTNPQLPFIANPIKVSFTYSQADFLGAVKAHHQANRNANFAYIPEIVMVGVAWYLWKWTVYQNLAFACIVLAILSGLLRLLVFQLIPRVSFSLNSKFRKEYYIEFTQNGVRFQAAGVESTLDWQVYQKTLQTRSFYLLYYGTHQYTIIPRRIFEQAEDDKKLENLLRLQIPNFNELKGR